MCYLPTKMRPGSIDFDGIVFKAFCAVGKSSTCSDSRQQTNGVEGVGALISKQESVVAALA